MQSAWLSFVRCVPSAATATAATCKYDPSIRRQIMERPPKLFISGHSHILKIKNDPLLGLLHINPGAAGLQGWQTERTLVRLTIDGATMKDCEVITLATPGRHSAL